MSRKNYGEKLEVWKKYYVQHCGIFDLIFCDIFIDDFSDFLLEHTNCRYCRGKSLKEQFKLKNA